ncbi:MAG: coproporphyrinogen III oxidase family protein [Puniceicoccales bacterium]|jgi:oxygen-independent coproporphyrinogen-3 oxidase|nr:coproporphyrinogen III oxidase family protein [Puniceicoccales bacterium]
MAPSTVQIDRLAALKEIGVTRISLGIQSFNDHTLKLFGRRQCHPVESYEMLRTNGFTNINMDMIFSPNHQTLRAWIDDLDQAIGLAPEHLSTYCMTKENDFNTSPDEDKEVKFYTETCNILRSNGFQQYEISNFCKPGQESLHNINTWKMGEWLGLGPSASSQYRFRRYTNIPSLRQWITGLDSNAPILIDDTKLSTKDLFIDSLLFGIRMNQGVDFTELAARFGDHSNANLKYLLYRLVDENYANINETNIALTDSGRLRCDAIELEILQCF